MLTQFELFARMNPTAPKLAVSCHEASKKIAVNATCSAHERKQAQRKRAQRGHPVTNQLAEREFDRSSARLNRIKIK